MFVKSRFCLSLGTKLNKVGHRQVFPPNFSSTPLQASVDSTLGVPFVCVADIDLG